MTEAPHQPLLPRASEEIARGRWVMLSVLVLVVAVPLVNLRSLMQDGLPRGLQAGMAHFAYSIGLTASVLLVLLWYFAWVGCRRAGLALGALYLLAACLGMAVPLIGLFTGNELRGGWTISLVLVGVYGLGGWSLVASPSVERFQAYQRAARETRRAGR